jgi:hypothetical protein
MFRARRARRCELALVEERLLSADRADEDRRFPSVPEYVDAEIRFRDVDEPPRLQPDVLEGFHVRLQREVIVYARRHVAPVRRRQRASSCFLEVHHLQEIFRARRQRIVRGDELLCPCACRGSDDGAGRDEEKELAAVL